MTVGSSGKPITADGGTNNFNFMGRIVRPTTVEVGGRISEVNDGKNNFTLDSKDTKDNKTNLAFKGASDKTITSLTALSNDVSSMNTLTIAENAKGANKITTLNLGNSSTKTGFLTIDNSSSKGLEITNFASQDAKNILTINTGKVTITNAVANAGLFLNGAQW